MRSRRRAGTGRPTPPQPGPIDRIFSYRISHGSVAKVGIRWPAHRLIGFSSAILTWFLHTCIPPTTVVALAPGPVVSISQANGLGTSCGYLQFYYSQGRMSMHTQRCTIYPYIRISFPQALQPRKLISLSGLAPKGGSVGWTVPARTDRQDGLSSFGNYALAPC